MAEPQGDDHVATLRSMVSRKRSELAIDIDSAGDEPSGSRLESPNSPVMGALQGIQNLVEQQKEKDEERNRKLMDSDEKIHALRQKVAEEEAELERLRAARQALEQEELAVDNEFKKKDWDAHLEKKMSKQELKQAKAKEMEANPPAVGYFGMLRAASGSELVYFVVGCLGAAGAGAMMPVFLWFFKDIMNDGFSASGAAASKVLNISYYFLIIGAIQGIFGAIEVACLTISAERQGLRLKQNYLRAILRQDQGWYDLMQVEQINSSMERDTLNVQDAIGHKTGQFVRQMCTAIGGIIIAFSRGWMMTLVCLSTAPIMGLVAAWLTKTLASFATAGEGAYALAGGVAEQAISGIRTVVSLSGHDREVNRYAAQLGAALAMGLRKARNNGIGMGTMNGVMLGSYALAMWFGGYLVTNEYESADGVKFTGGDVMLVFWAVMFGGFALGQIGPAFQAFGLGRASAARMFQVMDRVPPIDTQSNEGIILDPKQVQGNLEFHGVGFTYPARPDATIFNNLRLSIPAGQTVALVGSSGSGKSSVVGLIERFYDPTQGFVTLDGKDLRSINVRSLRRNIGLVGQEPTLFATTIAENIRYGKEDATQAEVEEAARAANAHAFIMTLPHKYETQVGPRGTQMSGGQKQRIAIARAVIANPKILLLDEATSALDAESERVVQEALDKVSEGRTTVVVAHRLSTIRGADKIVVFDKTLKSVMEEGTHDQLVAREGGYARLMKAQLGAAATTNVAKRISIARRNSHSQNGKKPAVEAPTEEEIKAAEKIPLVKQPKVKQENLVLRALRINKPERLWLVGGLLGALVNGAIFPVMAYVLTKALANFFICQPDAASPPNYSTFYKSADECLAEHTSGCMNTNGLVSYPYISKEACYDVLNDKQALLCIYFALLGVAAFIANMMQVWCFSVMGEYLTRRLRESAFTAALKNEMGWFDLKENSIGSLTALLSKETAYVEGAVGTTLGLMTQNLCLMVISLFIAFSQGWALTLICLAVMPVLVVSMNLQMKYMTGANATGKYGEAAHISVEATSASRTIAAFCSEQRVQNLYEGALSGFSKGLIKSAFAAGFGAGFSLTAMFLFNFVGFAGGAWLMSRGDYSFENVLQVFMSINFLGMGAGQAASLAPDVAKSKPAMLKVFGLIDRKSKIDPTDPSGEIVTEVSGDIELRDIYFKYPARPEVTIFEGMSLHIKPGTTVALVGGSGSGKSTVVSLIERFYDPDQGVVLLDGKDLRSLNLKSFRANIGLVGQEPTLFATTIAENIRYAKPDATMEEIETAARAANAHDFIMALPGKYETHVGSKGTQLSGGQKQRVAIARAMISDPRILLLDEATSALDAESERVVQEALDKLMKGRTTVVVAHRLSTIRNADNIAVFSHGVLVEQGTHAQLSSDPNSAYSLLVRTQMGIA